MTKLSVNVNKIATIRNARGGDNPNLVQVVKDCERFGAEGITVHPRPDERHIRYQDVYDLSEVVTTDFNIEGYPNQKFIDLVLDVKPAQVTLVPDPPGVLTSNAGWRIEENMDLLKDVITQFKSAGIRTSIFMDTDLENMKLAPLTGTDRVELYTESYAVNYEAKGADAIQPYLEAAMLVKELGLGLNAGHDLDLNNLKDFHSQLPNLLEVSIGHALVCDALYLGLENTIQLYLRQLQ
jgi:pyridoxine 5-phosphate synthase